MTFVDRQTNCAPAFIGAAIHYEPWQRSDISSDTRKAVLVYIVYHDRSFGI